MPAILRIILILFVVVWVFSGWPQMYGFPPKVREVYAQAFPVVEARLATNGGNSASSPLTVNLPADIQAGELLLVFLSVRTPSTMSWPTGWTEFFSGDNGTDAGLRVAYRQATGAEGSSISVTPGASSKHVAVAFRVSGAENPTTQAPQASTAATGSSTTPDPGSFTPTGGAKDYLWLAAHGRQESSVSTGAPANYGNLTTQGNGGGQASTQNQVATAERSLNASSEDPGTFSGGSNAPWVAVTVAVHPQTTITVSGKAYDDEVSTLWAGCNGSDARISLVVNGGTASTTSCDILGGSYQFTGVAGSANDPVSVFVNTAGGYTDKGVAVTVAADDTSNITLNPRKSRVWVKHETGVASISNSDLSHCHSSGIDCANVPYLTGPNGLTVESGIKLIVEFGKTFAPGQGVSTTSSGDASSLAGDILIQTGAMLSMGGAPLGVGGDYNNQGMFSQSAGQSVAFTATATGHTIVPGSGNFQGVSFNGSGGGWSFVAPVVIEENLLMLSGTLSGTRDITVNGGQVTADGGIISLTGGTFLLDGTGDFGGTPAWTFNNLTFGDGAGTATTTATGAGGITVTGVLTIAANQTLNAKLKTWTLSGTGTPLVITGTLTDSTPSSTFVYTGNGATTITASTAYHNLRVFPGGASVTHTLASGTFTLSGNLEIGGNGNGASTVVDAGMNNPTINVGGSVTICAVSCSNQMTFTKSSSAFAFSGSTTPVTWTDNNPTTKQDVGAVSIDGPKEVDLGSSVSATKVNVTEGDTLDLQSSGYTLTLTGSGVGASRPFSVGGTLSAGTDSTVSFTGSGSSDIESQTYWNLDFTPVSGSLSYFLDSGTFSMGGDWTMTGATSLNVFATANPVIAVEGDVTIGANAALTASSTAAFTVKGNWSNTGTFTHNSGTVTFNATATGKTIAPGGSDFFNVVFNGSGGGWSFSSAVVIEGDLTMSAGTLSGTNDVTVLGTVVGTAGIINFTAGGTFEQRVAAGQSFGTTSGSANWQFFNLTFSNSSGTGQTITANSGGTGTVGVIGALTIGKGADAATTTFDAGNRTWILSDGSCPCTPFVVDGTNGVFDAGTSTFRYAGKVGAFTIAAETYYNLESKPGSTATHTLASGTFTVNNNLEIGTGINASSVTAATNNPVLNVSNNVTINATATLIASGSSAFTVGGNWSNNGIFTHNSGTVTFDAATTSVISGATAWNNFTSATPGKTLQFEAGTTQTFEGAFTVTGAVGNLIAIQSDATGTKWTADFTNQQGSEGSPTVTHAAVQDSGCAPASANAVLDSTSQDDGNNEDCWVFFVAEQGEPAPSPGMGSFTPLQINTVEVREVTPTAVLVSWRTLAEVTTEIAWAVSVPELGEPAYRDSSFKTAHEVLIENLAPGTAYVFAIYANAPAWGTVSAGPFPFLTLEEETEQPQEPQEPDEPAPEGRVVFSGNQIQSILDFLSSFSVDSATLARVESALRGSPVPQAPGSGAIPGIPAGFSFAGTLREGNSGNDVRYLQVVLNADPDTRVASSGAGSPGSETEFFGPLTRAALVKFQEKHAEEILAPWGIASGTGVMGSTTRAKLLLLLEAGL